MDSNGNSKSNKHTKLLFSLLIGLLFWESVSLLLFPKANLTASDLTVPNILQAVSQERVANNLSSLNTDNRLSIAAQYKSDDMQARHYFSHTDPEGKYIWGKISESGYTPYLQLGENLAIEFFSTESLVSAWMNSPTHRANILNQSFVDQGMGLTFGDPNQGKYFSAIANTFGALVPQKKPAPAPTPKPASIRTPPQTAPISTPVPKPASTPTPATSTPITVPTAPAETKSSQDKAPENQAPKEPLRDRFSQNTDSQQNFTLPEAKDETKQATDTPVLEAVVPAQERSQGMTAYEINHYLMLGLAMVLVVLVVTDLKKILGEKLAHYDKKINNLVLLIVSLIVIAFVYWL